MTETQLNSRPTTIRRQIVGLLMGFTFLGHFNRISITVAANSELIGPEKLTEQQMGQVYSAFLLVYTCCMIPGGWIIDRFGPRAALALMGIGMGFCVLLTGMLGLSGLPTVSLFIPLLAIRSLAGGFSTPLHPGAARTVSLWLPLTSRSTANGLVTAGALIGISMTYPGYGWLMDRFGWATAFVICGSVMIAYSVVWIAVSSDSVSNHPRANAAEKQLVLSGEQPGTRVTPTLSDLLLLFRNRGLTLLTLSYALMSYFQYLFFYWIDYYFGKVLELPETWSRRASMIVMLSMAAGMGLGGLAADFFSKRYGLRTGCRVVAIFGMLLSAVCAWFGVLVKAPGSVVILFSAALAALGLCEGVFWTTAPALEPRNGGLACAFLNTIGNVGGLLAPVCTPWLGMHFGWPAAIGVACTSCACAAFVWFAIDPEQRSLQGIQPVPAED